MPHRRSDRGSAAVEFALILPILLVIALAMVQVGLFARDRLLVEAAAFTLTVTRTGTRGDPVQVSVTYVDHVRVPFVDWLVGSSVTMDTSASARQEFG